MQLHDLLENHSQWELILLYEAIAFLKVCAQMFEYEMFALYKVD